MVPHVDPPLETTPPPEIVVLDNVVEARIIRLTLEPRNAEGYLPLAVRIFHNDSIYWIQTRVKPTVSMLQLLRHLLDEIEKRLRIRLPVSLFHYNIFDMAGGEMLGPDALASGVVGPLLFLYETEFVNAFDRERRVRLITDLIRDIDQAEQKKAAKQIAAQENAGGTSGGTKGGTSESNGQPAPEAVLEAVPEAASAAEKEADVKKRPNVGAYAYWQQMMR